MLAPTNEMILVAGGAGFIGSHLCKALLDQGHHVVCLDNLQTGRESNLRRLEHEPRFEFVRADVVHPLPASITQRPVRFTRIYNLACAASPPQYQADPEHTLLTNVLGSHHLLRFAERTGARYLLTSTSEVYGDPEVHPQNESYRGLVNCTGPRACYDEGKRAAEALTFDFARLGRADVRVARIFNTYGPQMHPDDGRVVSNLLCQALQGREITVYGDGSQTRSFCYVSDIVAGLIALMESETVGLEPVNLGNPNELTVSDLLVKVLALTGAQAPVVHRSLPIDDPRRRRPDISRAQALLDWHPSTPLDEGLRATCEWFARELRTPPDPAPSMETATDRRPAQAAIIDRERVYDGWYKLDRVAVRMPDGQSVERHVEDHGPAASVLAYDPDRRTALLVSMPRAPQLLAEAPPLLEAVAGNLDGTGPEETARREALEEAGVRLGALEPVANVWSLPALSTERLALFLAAYSLADRVGAGGGAAGESENIEVHEMELRDLASAADAGTLADAKTLLLVQTLRLRQPQLFA